MMPGYFDHLKPVPTTPSTPSNVVQLNGGEGDSRYGLAALTSEAAEVATAPAGTRNDTLNRALFRMGRHVAGGELREETVLTALADAARQSGLPEDEISLVLRSDETSALRAASSAPRVAPPLTDAPATTVLPEPTGDPQVDAEAVSNAVRNRFPLLDWHELWTREETEEWIVEPVLPARRLVALFSPPKVGKSLLMLEIAVAVARGSEVLGTTPERSRRVLYVDFENDPRGDIYERLVAMGQAPEDLGDLCYLSYPTISKLDTVAGASELLAIVEEYGCEVVVIDTISRAVAGEENENDTWLAFYRNTGLAMKQAGVACIRLDHTGKDHDKGMRGGSAKYGDVDAVWKLSTVTDGDVYRLDCTDHRMPIAEKTLVLKRLSTPHLHHKVEAEGRAAATRAKVEQIIAALDGLGVPNDAGRDAAAQALRGTGVRARNDDLSAAVKERKRAAGVLWKPDSEVL